jgi:XisI protein
MIELETVRLAVQAVLSDYAEYMRPKAPGQLDRERAEGRDVQLQTIFDTMHDHYQLTWVGWENGTQIFDPVIHIDIREGKIWIQLNHTEEEIVDELFKWGVRHQDIVLGLHSPEMRKYTDFAAE